MTHFTGKAALFALSIISASACASHWSYEGEGAPEHWGELDEAYKTCQSGMNQSPINIESTANAHLSPLQTHYIDGPVTLTNNGHTIQACEKPETRDTLTLDKQTWTLQQFHFHAPSENTVHGKKFAMEMHLVHKNAAGELAVVAVMFDKGATNPEMIPLTCYPLNPPQFLLSAALIRRFVCCLSRKWGRSGSAVKSLTSRSLHLVTGTSR